MPSLLPANLTRDRLWAGFTAFCLTLMLAAHSLEAASHFGHCDEHACATCLKPGTDSLALAANNCRFDQSPGHAEAFTTSEAKHPGLSQIHRPRGPPVA